MAILKKKTQKKELDAYDPEIRKKIEETVTYNLLRLKSKLISDISTGNNK